MKLIHYSHEVLSKAKYEGVLNYLLKFLVKIDLYFLIVSVQSSANDIQTFTFQMKIQRIFH